MSIRERVGKRRERRAFRVRNRIRRDSNGRLRMSVFRSNKHMYAQIIDDVAGNTVVSVSTLDKAIAGPGKYAGNKDAAAQVGKLLAERAAGKGIKEVVFDRGDYRYHGRVASLAEAAREAGLEF
jgi:large subunit ribosomal protein L18